MLQRAFIHISLILLFAFTQIGVVTHQISHLAEHHEEHQQEQDSHENQCSQCISYKHMANANVAHPFQFAIAALNDTYVSDYPNSASHSQHYIYSARAPPKPHLS